MAITRRQFVTRLGALAAAMGVSQVDLAKITEAFAHGGIWTGAWTDKPKVIWVHGAECTGCSTSLLSLFEDVRGKAIEGTTISTLKALDLAVGGDGTGTTVLPPSLGGVVDATHPYGHRTLYETAGLTSSDFDNGANSTPYIANIADVLIDFIDLQYHETVMGPAGDLAYKWLADQMAASTEPFVMVVEGAVQDKARNGAWNAAGPVPWCSIAQSEDGTGYSGKDAELSFDDVVFDIGTQGACAAIIAIGQCATFGGYPGCVSPLPEFKGMSQTGALGTYNFFQQRSTAPGDAAALASQKVINVPGCPTNPGWFVLTVVAWLVDATAILAGGSSILGILGPGLAINAAAVDKTRRLKAVYGTPLHGPYCTRYQDFLNGVFAAKPGDGGCLQLIGCKGPSTMTLCGPHGWNSQQPRNATAWEGGLASVNGNKGGNCIAGGHPCMACTEKGYPDAFVPFVVR